MFETYDNEKLIIPAEIRRPGQHIWWSIKMQLHTSWFHVTYEEKYNEDGEEITLQTIIFLSTVPDLLDFSNITEYKIKQVYLVSPDYLNGTNNWKMERLKEIWEADEPEPVGRRAFIFIIDGNKKYIESRINTTEEMLANKRKVFSVNNK